MAGTDSGVGSSGVPNIAALLAGVNGRSADLLAPEYALNNATFNVRDYGLVSDGVTDDSAALIAMLAALTIYARPMIDVVGVVRLGANVSIPSNVDVRFLHGATFSTAGGVTLSISGRIIAPGRVRIFEGAGTATFSQNATPYIFPEFWGAAPSASAADNVTAIRAAIAVQLADGGTIQFAPRAVYPVNATLDFRNATQAKRDYVRNIDFNGCTLTWAASGMVAGDLVQLGGVTPADAPEHVFSDIGRLYIIGPETAAAMTPRYATNPGADAAPATTVRGLVVENGLNLNVHDVIVERCYTGTYWSFVWGGTCERIKALYCLIAHDIQAGCTHFVGRHFESVLCTFSAVGRWLGVGAALGIVQLEEMRIEDCTLGPIFDPGNNAGAEIVAVKFSAYMEDVWSDHFRAGLAFDATPANYATRTDRTGKVGVVEARISLASGDGWSGAGVGVVGTWSSGRKAAAFAGAANVLSADLQLPCEVGDVVNLPDHAAFRSLVRTADRAAQETDSILPGFGIARLNGATGVPEYSRGNIDAAATARAGVGLYDVVFSSPYINSDSFVAVVVPHKDAGGLYATIDATGGVTTAGKVRIEIRTDAGVLTDSGSRVMVWGTLAAQP